MKPTSHPHTTETVDRLEQAAIRAELEATAKRRAALPQVRAAGEAAAARARECRATIQKLLAAHHA